PLNFFQQLFVLQRLLDELILLLIGGATVLGDRLAGLVFAAENPLLQRRISDLADAGLGAQRKNFLLDVAIEQVVARLAALGFKISVAADFQTVFDLLDGPVREAPVNDFALMDQIVEGADRFLQRRVLILPVA